MAEAWILALDQGTTNTKALLVDSQGRAVFRASAPVDLLQPRPGYVEQDPFALWDSVSTVIAHCIIHAKTKGASIAAIALTNQRETAITWRRTSFGNATCGDPIGNAISWQCRRSAPVCERLRSCADAVQSTTGLPLDPLLSATKWAWLLEEHAELRSAVRSGDVLFGTVDSWLLYNLTGGRVHATDHTNASRTALLSLDSLAWDDAMLSLFGIPREALPEVLPSAGIFGECATIPSLFGVPIISMIGDSHAAMVGHGRYEPGTVKATYGTGSSIMMLTPSLVKEGKGLARTVAWSTANAVQFALEGNISMSGAALQWVGEFLGLPNPIEGAAELAATVADSAGLALVPAMVGLGAPHWDANARGIVSGLERSHRAAHMARAAVDAIAFQIADVLEAMEGTASLELPALLADGGATRNHVLMQLQADMINRPVYRSAQEDLSAFGAAMLAGLTIGWWKSFDELAALPKDAQEFRPLMPNKDRDRMRSAWRLAVRRARIASEIAS